MDTVTLATGGATSTRGGQARRNAGGYDAGELRLAKKLARCLDALRNGRGVEEILGRYGRAEADELRPLLEIASMLQERYRSARLAEPKPAPR